MPISTIYLKGKKIVSTPAVAPITDDLVLEASYEIATSIRGSVETHEIRVHEQTLFQFEFEDDTVWLSDTDDLAQLFPAANQLGRGEEGFMLPSYLPVGGAQRGLISDVAMKLVHVFTRPVLDEKIGAFAEDLEKKQLDNKSGLYQLTDDFQLKDYTPEAARKTYLLFIHGTNSSTSGSFNGLKDSPTWSFIRSRYATSVLAFQHETLTKSPLLNLLELVRALPAESTIHVITHSRGGLIGDLLARFCNADENNRGFDQHEIDYLEQENRPDDVKRIHEIRAVLSGKRIFVEKFIRVACPAAGTILASGRLENFFNISLNLVGLAVGGAAMPIFSAFRRLIAAVMDTKDNVDVLPGLEAMNPDSPFIKALNNPSSSVIVDQPLTVIAGNCKVRLNKKALVAIAGRMFYQRNNDLVVNTRSMYEGAKRAELVQYLFDEEDEVDHFSYFSNPRTQEALLQALKSSPNVLIPGFRRERQSTLVEQQRQALLHLEGGDVFTNLVTGTRPILVLLPGIMGSNLTCNGDRIWIDYGSLLKGRILDLAIDRDGVTASTLVKTSYKRIVDFFKDKYDVITFPFDWRQALDVTANRLHEKLRELMLFNQPIKIIGHSMGGVLFRDLLLGHPTIWKDLCEKHEARMIFLGAPLRGSFRIPSVLFGQDTIISTLSRLDIFHTKKQLLNMFCRMPGLLSLLPLSTVTEHDFAAESTWKNMNVVDDAWPIPDEKDRNRFGAYRDKVLQQIDSLDFSRMAYVAGKDDATPCGYRVENGKKGKRLVFLTTPEGDQSVTWEMGIPRSMIEKGLVYYTEVSHGSLANEPMLFRGLADLLQSGFTNALTRKRPVVRGGEKVMIAPNLYNFDLTPEGVVAALLSLNNERAPTISRSRLQVSICHGDLHYATYPVMAGHFRNDGILYAEKAVDRYMKGALSQRLQLALYPGDIGTSELFQGTSDFKGAVIVGLGEPGNLTAYRLQQTVELAICKYLLEINGSIAKAVDGSMPDQIGISTLMIGSGYGGLTVENTVRALLQAVSNANAKIQAIDEAARLVQHVEFIELYNDIALSCLYALLRLQQEENFAVPIILEQQSVKTFFGSKRRLPSEQRANWWNRINVQLVSKPDLHKDTRCLLFSSSTGAAREEQRELYTSTGIIEQLLSDLSATSSWSRHLAKTVFELLIPNDFKEQLKRQGNINWILDKNTAGYPWELLHDGTEDAKPFCVETGMIRQLATSEYRIKIQSVTSNEALVVGDPLLDGFLPQLPGAKEEAEKVTALFRGNGLITADVISDHSFHIIKELFKTGYKVIHLAGHGLFEEWSGVDEKTKVPRSGMVIGKDVFLTTAEFSQMSTTPEFVFVNCCHLGKIDGHKEAYYGSRYKLAANIGTQLIENGVRAVIVAGWAVSDAAALDFTLVFYRYMFEGYTFGDATREARKVIFEKYPTNNTWGAYQCYGDPHYRFRQEQVYHSANGEASFSTAHEAEIVLENLHSELETNNYDNTYFINKLENIEQALERSGLAEPRLYELVAYIYFELGEYATAVNIFERLLRFEKAVFSVASLEKFCNVRSKKYVVEAAIEGNTKDYTAEMEQVIRDLQHLATIAPTAERLNLLGSAYKRKAFLQKDPAGKKQDYLTAAAFYLKAQQTPSNRNVMYSLTNYLVLHLLDDSAVEDKWKTQLLVDQQLTSFSDLPQVVALLKNLLQKVPKSAQQMDFWDLVYESNGRLCLLVIDPASVDNKAWQEVLHLYRKVWAMAGSRGKKMAEIEHLDILLDALSLVQTEENQLLGDLKTLTEQLRKIM